MFLVIDRLVCKLMKNSYNITYTFRCLWLDDSVLTLFSCIMFFKKMELDFGFSASFMELLIHCHILNAEATPPPPLIESEVHMLVPLTWILVKWNTHYLEYWLYHWQLQQITPFPGFSLEISQSLRPKYPISRENGNTRYAFEWGGGGQKAGQILTLLLLHGKNIPSTKRPSSGPPITPNIVTVSCKMVPIFEAAKASAMQTTP